MLLSATLVTQHKQQDAGQVQPGAAGCASRACGRLLRVWRAVGCLTLCCWDVLICSPVVQLDTAQLTRFTRAGCVAAGWLAAADACLCTYLALKYLPYESDFMHRVAETLYSCLACHLPNKSCTKNTLPCLNMFGAGAWVLLHEMPILAFADQLVSLSPADKAAQSVAWIAIFCSVDSYGICIRLQQDGCSARSFPPCPSLAAVMGCTGHGIWVWKCAHGLQGDHHLPHTVWFCMYLNCSASTLVHALRCVCALM